MESVSDAEYTDAQVEESMGMMRRTKRSGGFWLCLLLNLLLNLEWSIPAWILLALHYLIGLSLWFFAAALFIWIIIIMIGMWLMGWAASCGSEPTPQRENKNPYSVKATKFTKYKE